MMRVLAAGVISGVLCYAPSLAAQASHPTDQRVRIGRLPCATPQKPRAHGLRQLVWELMKRTSVEAEMESVEVDPGDPTLYWTPFLIWSCQGPVAQLEEKGFDNLRRFLVLGGFLFIDDPTATPGGGFDQSVREALARLFPGKQRRDVPGSHVLFKTFFLVDRPAGRLRAGRVQAVEVGDRLAVVYSPNDLLGAVSKDLYGNWEHVCEPGGERQREMAFRLGINIFYYALCLDYKDDRVHLPFILKRRKL